MKSRNFKSAKGSGLLDPEKKIRGKSFDIRNSLFDIRYLFFFGSQFTINCSLLLTNGLHPSSYPYECPPQEEH